MTSLYSVVHSSASHTHRVSSAMEGRTGCDGNDGDGHHHQHHSHLQPPPPQPQQLLPGTTSSTPAGTTTPTTTTTATPNTIGTTRVITDAHGESEDTFTESNYDSQSTLSSSFASTSVGSGLVDRGRGGSYTTTAAVMPHHQQAPPPQQQHHISPNQTNLPPSVGNTNHTSTVSSRRRVAVRDGEITGCTASARIPSAAIVRRKPLHETLDENTSEDNFEVALTWHRSKRILLSRLVETTPNGRLSLVRVLVCREGVFVFCFWRG
jgi:hypothetical protein